MTQIVDTAGTEAAPGNDDGPTPIEQLASGVMEPAPGAGLAAKLATDELAGELLARADRQGVSLVGPDGLLAGLTKTVLESALEAEMTEHVGYDAHDPAGHHSGNSRNGARTKTVITDIGPVEIEVPRDRAGTFEPQIVKKRQRRLGGVDSLVCSLSAKGLTHGEISAHLGEVYGAEVSKETITRITDHGHEIVSDEDYAGLYADGTGRPSVPPSVMIRAMLCATHDRTSDRETSRRTRVDMDWKAAMGVDDDFAGIGATTFALMRARMIVADVDGKLFKRTIVKAVDAGVLRGKLTAIIDSSPVHGAGNVADTYELVRKLAAGWPGRWAAISTPIWPLPLKRSVPPRLTSTGRTPRRVGASSKSWWNWPVICWPRRERAMWLTTRRSSRRRICWPRSSTKTLWWVTTAKRLSVTGLRLIGWCRTRTRRCATDESLSRGVLMGTSWI